uniref:GNVR domain-containing protein n=1 Tax=Pseudomonas aeruginosa TaxID=287 RepID=UPI000A4A33DC
RGITVRMRVEWVSESAWNPQVRIDQKASTPLKPIKPRKALVVALGLLGGLVFGVLVALVRAMLRAPRQRVQEDSLPPGVVSLDRSLSGT